MNVAVSWPPSAPPSVRMTVFMPLATPVWVGGHGLHDQVAERREREPDPDPEQRGGDQHLVRVGVRGGRVRERDGGDGGAGDERRLGAEPVGDAPGERPEQRIVERRGQQVEARDDDRGAEPEPGARGQLRELREAR